MPRKGRCAGRPGDPFRGRLTRLGEMSEEYAQLLHRGSGGSMYKRLPGGGEDFVELGGPELQRRGVFRTEYEGKTLRENLGLKRPVSRYAAAGLDRNLDAAK